MMEKQTNLLLSCMGSERIRQTSLLRFMYFLTKYCAIYLLYMAVFLSFFSDLHYKHCHATVFIHVLTNVLEGLNGVTVSVFMCCLYVFDSKHEYGTTY